MPARQGGRDNQTIAGRTYEINVKKRRLATTLRRCGDREIGMDFEQVREVGSRSSIIPLPQPVAGSLGPYFRNKPTVFVNGLRSANATFSGQGSHTASSSIPSPARCSFFLVMFEFTPGMPWTDQKWLFQFSPASASKMAESLIVLCSSFLTIGMSAFPSVLINGSAFLDQLGVKLDPVSPCPQCRLSRSDNRQALCPRESGQ